MINNTFRLSNIVFCLFLLILIGCSSDNSFVSKYKYDYFTMKYELEFVQLGAQLPWAHNISLIGNVKEKKRNL